MCNGKEHNMLSVILTKCIHKDFGFEFDVDHGSERYAEEEEEINLYA